MKPESKTEVVYNAKFSDRELGIFERVVTVLEDFADAIRSEPGLEGGRSLLSTFNRAFDQIAFHHEASTRHVESSTRLNETYVELLRKQIENQQKIIETQNALAKSIEEVKKAQAGQSSAIQSLDKRLKNIEVGKTPGGGGPKGPFRDDRNKSQPQRNNTKTENPSAAPTTHEEQPAKKEGTVVIARPAPRETNEVSKSTNNALQEQVSLMAVKAG